MLELVRFVENGNVLLMPEGAAIHEHVSVEWPGVVLYSARDPLTCSQVAAVDINGNLHLAGSLFQRQSAAEMSGGANALEVRRNTDKELACSITTGGDLKLRDFNDTELPPGAERRPPTGNLLIHGIEYDLLPAGCPNCSNDKYLDQ